MEEETCAARILPAGPRRSAGHFLEPITLSVFSCPTAAQRHLCISSLPDPTCFCEIPVTAQPSAALPFPSRALENNVTFPSGSLKVAQVFRDEGSSENIIAGRDLDKMHSWTEHSLEGNAFLLWLKGGFLGLS